MRRMLRTIAPVVVMAPLFLTTGGCMKWFQQRDPNDVSFGAVAKHPTPELRGLTERQVDWRRHRVVARNQNWRMMWDDLHRAFAVDHPSRLSPLPIADTSGMPR